MWNVLLVDDEEAIRNLLKTVLEMGDFKIATADSAAHAISILRSQKFDAVVTDLRMESKRAGFEVVAYAKALNPTPVIAIVTAFPVPPSEWRKIGADALFTKGTDTLQLGWRLESLLAVRNTTSSAAKAHRTE